MVIKKIYNPEGKSVVSFPRNHGGLVAAISFVREKDLTHLDNGGKISWISLREAKIVVEGSIGSDPVFGEAYNLPCEIVFFQ